MSRTFDSFQKSTIKNAAKAVAHFQARKDKLDEQIAALEAQKAELNAQIETYNKAVTDLTGGYTPLELCEKVSRGSGGQNDWVFKYPSTIIPPTPEAETQAPVEEETQHEPANEEVAEVAAPENPAAEQPADTQPENPENNETQEETYEPSDAGGALPEAPAPAEAPRDPMDDIFA